MKHIDSCGSLRDPSISNINSSLIHFHKKFKLTPLAIACLTVIASFPVCAQHKSFSSTDITQPQLEALEVVWGENGNNLWTIGGSIDLSQFTDLSDKFKDPQNNANDLIGFFRPDTTEIDDPEEQRVHIGRNEVDDKGWIFLIDSPCDYNKEGDKVKDEGQKDSNFNAIVHFYNGNDKQPWNVRYNFATDGNQAGTENPNSYDTSVLSFFDPSNITSDSLNGLKFFIFEPQVNLISQNHLVATDNSADSKADIGLSLSNKRKNITFNEKVNFISSFSFYDNGTTAQPDTTSGVDGLRIASGVYNAFGAANLKEVSGKNLQNWLFKENTPTAYAEALGVITFNEFTNISITHTSRDKYTEPTDEHDEHNEVFGVFNNEGGTTSFKNGANIIVKGTSNDRIISAITSSATKGILDPLKQGTVNIQASTDADSTTRIWGIVDTDSTNIIDPFKTMGAEEFNETNWSEYITALETSDNLELSAAVISLHASNVTIKDNSNGGNVDIRGDIISGTLNGYGSISNTVGDEDITIQAKPWANLNGTVIRSNVDITLNNKKSILYGNLYERHRIGEEESVKDTYKNFRDESFKEWQDLQISEEQKTLGGNISLSLSNGATWMPQQNWYGWNYDFLYKKFYEEYDSLKDDTVTSQTNNIEYEHLDLSDQYNLNVWNGTEYDTVNQPLKDNNNLNNSAINDFDLLDKNANTNYFPDINKTDFETVDNGIYHLTLNDGGIVDTRYMRQAFKFNNIDAINNGDFSSSEIDTTGIRKLRIQELSGTGGTFNIYVENKDYHDLIIIDKLVESADSASTIDFNIWNEAVDGFDETLGLEENNPNTYIQIGRVAKNLGYASTIKLSPRDGDIQSVTYSIEEDDENYTWTKKQLLEYQEQMKNLFITKADIKTAPEIIEGARLSSSLAYNYAIMDIDRLQKRRGEARHIKDSDDGIWARYRHINSGLTGNDDSADMIQIGYDYKVRNAESYNVYSIAVDYLRGQSDFDSSGDSDLNRYSLGLYDTWLLDNGAYLDLTAKVGWFDADMDARFKLPDGFYDVSGDYDFWGASVGAEIGRKFSNKDQWFFEPQTQLTYTYIGSFDFTTDRNVKVESESIDSLIMRWGLRVGKDFGTSAEDGLYSIYLMGDVMHDFLGDQELTVTGLRTNNSAVADFDGERTWYDVGVGFSCTLSENSYMFINYERSLGHDIDNTWEISAGASLAF